MYSESTPKEGVLGGSAQNRCEEHLELAILRLHTRLSHVDSNEHYKWV